MERQQTELIKLYHVFDTIGLKWKEWVSQMNKTQVVKSQAKNYTQNLLSHSKLSAFSEWAGILGRPSWLQDVSAYNWKLASLIACRFRTRSSHYYYYYY